MNAGKSESAPTHPGPRHQVFNSQAARTAIIQVVRDLGGPNFGRGELNQPDGLANKLHGLVGDEPAFLGYLYDNYSVGFPRNTQMTPLRYAFTYGQMENTMHGQVHDMRGWEGGTVYGEDSLAPPGQNVMP